MDDQNIEFSQASIDSHDAFVTQLGQTTLSMHARNGSSTVYYTMIGAFLNFKFPSIYDQGHPANIGSYIMKDITDATPRLNEYAEARHEEGV